ncbi:MAG: HAF repeat-containing protein [Verrucomicrobia bacterium]|nr:HAF repeat-containing protein [Verrucomicrobiota bacterium]
MKTLDRSCFYNPRTLIVGFLCLLLVSAANGQTKYTVTDLGLPNPSVAVSINNSGQVVGWYLDDNEVYHAFLYRNGQVSDLGNLGPANDPANFGASASGINNRGQVVGGSYSSNATPNPLTGNPSPEHAFLYSRGQMQDPGIGGDSNHATGINNRGQVIGSFFIYDNLPSFEQHAFLCSEGQVIDLGNLGGINSGAVSINDRGQVVGWSDVSKNPFNAPYHAFLYSGGQMIDLGTLGTYAGGLSVAEGINNSGQIVGWSSSNDINLPYHAFLYSRGQMIDLGNLGGNYSVANSINDSGQIVGGSYLNGSTGDYHAFLYSNGQMQDLNNLLEPSSGWIVDMATSINSAGQITGYGTLNGVGTHALLLTPVLK